MVLVFYNYMESKKNNRFRYSLVAKLLSRMFGGLVRSRYGVGTVPGTEKNIKDLFQIFRA
jgi:hypothetical protein